MDFKSLHCFAELVRLQSFSAAASALNLTQPTVSKTIQALKKSWACRCWLKKTAAKTPGRHHAHRRRSVPPCAEPPARTRPAARPHRRLPPHQKRHAAAGFGIARQRPAQQRPVPLPPPMARHRTDLPRTRFARHRTILAQQRTRRRTTARPVHEDFDSITLCDYPLVVLMPRTQARHAASASKACNTNRLSCSAQGFPSTKPSKPPAAAKASPPTSSAAPDNGTCSPTWWRTIWASPFCPNTTPAKSTPTPSPPSR